MKCKRCGQEFNTDIVELNVEAYDTHPLFACPHCGKAYFVRRIIRINFEPLDDMTLGTVKCDNWGEKIVTDKSYEKKKNKKQCTEE